MRQLKARGLTLVELMVGLAISALLALSAAPFFGDYIANSRLREAGNALYTETLFAQSEAQKRNARVQVSLVGSTIRTLDFSAGGAGELIREFGLAAPVTVSTNTSFDFGSNGRPLLAASGQPVDVAVNLVVAGSVCTTERRCPGLRVDAGGAVRLCGDYVNACN